MGIEQDAVAIFLGVIIFVLVGEFVVGNVLLRGKNRPVKKYLYGHIISMLAGYFFLFNCYFHTVDGISNMTFGIGLFILAWAVSIVFFVKIIAFFGNI